MPDKLDNRDAVIRQFWAVYMSAEVQKNGDVKGFAAYADKLPREHEHLAQRYAEAVWQKINRDGRDPDECVATGVAAAREAIAWLPREQPPTAERRAENVKALGEVMDIATRINALCDSRGIPRGYDPIRLELYGLHGQILARAYASPDEIMAVVKARLDYLDPDSVLPEAVVPHSLPRATPDDSDEIHPEAARQLAEAERLGMLKREGDLWLDGEQVARGV